MTPKEKAKQLVQTYLNAPINYPCYDTYHGECIGVTYMTQDSALKFALMLVDEVLVELDDNYDTLHSSDRKQYWRQVKQEIETFEQ